MDEFKAEMNRRVGGGGIHCQCCNKYFGKDRKKLRRLARRVANKIKFETEE